MSEMPSAGGQRPLPELDMELLSAYLDGALTESERRIVQSRLEHEPDLQAVYADLQRTVALLRGLPPLRAPRNYTLTAQMVGLNAAAGGSQPRRAKVIPFYYSTAFSALSAAAAVILLVIGFGLFTMRNSAVPAAVGMLTTQSIEVPSNSQGDQAEVQSDLRDAQATSTVATEGLRAADGTIAQSEEARPNQPDVSRIVGEAYGIDVGTPSDLLPGDFYTFEPNATLNLQVDQTVLQATLSQAEQDAQSQAFVQDSNGIGAASASGGAAPGTAPDTGAANNAAPVAPALAQTMPTMTAQPMPFVQSAPSAAQSSSSGMAAPTMVAMATQGPTQTKSPFPTATPQPSSTPTDTPTITPSVTPSVTPSTVPTLTAPAPAPPITPSTSANDIFGLVVVGTALFFTAITIATTWARRRFKRNNSVEP